MPVFLTCAGFNSVDDVWPDLETAEKEVLADIRSTASKAVLGHAITHPIYEIEPGQNQYKKEYLYECLIKVNDETGEVKLKFKKLAPPTSKGKRPVLVEWTEQLARTPKRKPPRDRRPPLEIPKKHIDKLPLAV